MNLLDKFNQVEIAPDTRISEEDRQFCELQQEAYNHSHIVLKFMAEQGKNYLDEHIQIVKRFSDSNTVASYDGYLGKFDPSEYIKTLHGSHRSFIGRIFSHFARKYKVTIDSEAAVEAMVPKAPEDGYRYNKDEWDEYHKTLSEMKLNYKDVLEHIFIQLGGCTFQDKAVQELKQKAHDAAWNSYRGTKNYEQKKSVISFKNYACSFDSWHEEYYKGEHQIKLPNSMKDVIRALVHFEYGSTDFVPYGLSVFLDYDWKTYDTEMQVNLNKIKSIKCFKNGRVDIRFQSEAFAREFAEVYLGVEAA